MKHYEVRMTMLVAVTVSVEAENEEHAREQAMLKTGNDESYYLHKYDSVWEREVIEVNECEPNEERTTLDNALDYVREQLDSDDLAIIRAKVSKNMKERCSAWYGVDYAKVEELLYEYGEDHDLIDENADEEWWEKYGDIDDILIKL